ncbi:transcription factor TFIIIC subunit tfc4 [Ascosphaera aggregata]|nr:transcription factor TFIIIC subunit tfc4 [Ascosphaera aggregata]
MSTTMSQVGDDHFSSNHENEYPDPHYASDQSPKRRKLIHDSDESDYQPSEQTWSPRYGGDRPPARGGKRGPRKPVEPSQEFKNLHSEATSAFIDSDYDRAVVLVKQAISINPEIFAAHSLLSEIFLAQGQKEKALAALFTGAHTRPKDPAAWLKVADLVLDLAGSNRTAALNDVIYCYSRVIDVDQKNYQTRLDRAAAYHELGHNGRAATEYERLCKDLPHNMEPLRSLARIYIELNEVEKARSRYEEVISHYMAAPANEPCEFDWSDINIYIELFGYLNEYEQGIAALKFLSRWFLGRQEDSRWDYVVKDDREFDAEDHPRRLEMHWFTPGQYPAESYGLGLPLELRIKLGVYRLKLGLDNVDEALSHFSWLEPEDTPPTSHVEEYNDLFREAGDALRDAGLWSEALHYYLPLQHIPHCADTDLFMSIAKCHAGNGNHEAAENCYLTVVEYDENNVEARAGLAKFYDKLGMTEQALKYANEVIELVCDDTVPPRRKGAARSGRVEQLARILRAKDAQGVGTFLPRRPIREHIAESYGEVETGPDLSLVASTSALAVQKRRETAVQHAPGTRKEQVQYLHSKLIELSPVMREGDAVATEDWLDIADALIRDFRSTKIFFPVQRRAVFSGYSRESHKQSGNAKSAELLHEMQEIVGRLQTIQGESEADTSVPTDYHGISFDDWLDIFLEYALVLAGQGNKDEVYDTLATAADASIWYHSKKFTRQIYDEVTLSNISRWFMKEYQFVTDTYRLFATLSRSCGDPRKSLFHSSPSMKFMLRQIKAIDYTLPNDPFNLTQVRRTRESVFQERAALTTKDAEGKLIAAENMDVAILLIYGHILYAGTSYTNALNYFFRAYALDPENPAILLSIGLSYIHHSLKRQSDNRHYLIMQGLSFMKEYERIISGSNVLQEKQEAEFNLARVWHMLGLAHLAIDGYKKCLAIGELIQRKREEARERGNSGVWSEDFTRDAAYALQCLYMFSGDSKSARDVTEMYLTI